MAIASLVIRIAADLADFEKGIAGAERSLQRTGRNLESIGSRLTRGLTVPLVAGIGLAAKAAIDFESSFAGVRKTVDATEGQFKELEGAFRGLAKTMPLAVNEINKVAESAGQLGVKRENIIEFTQSMIKLGTATNLTADEAAIGMARFANALGQPNINMEKLGSALVALGNAGASTEKDILSMAGNIAGAGSQIGLSAGSIFGIANALSSVGIEAEKGGSAISRLFNDLNSAVSKGGQQLKDFAAVAGLLPEAFSRLFKEDSAAAITKFIEGLHAQKAAGTDLLKVLDDLGISELRYRDTVLLAANAGPAFAESIRLGNSSFAEGTALQKEYAERLKTTASQLHLLKGNVNDVLIILGQSFLPLIKEFVITAKPFVERLAEMAKAFGELPAGVRNTALAFAAVLASLGPIVFVVSQVTQAWAGILGLTRVLIPDIAKLGTTFTGVGTTLTRFAGPIALVAAGLFALKETWDAFNRSTEDGLKVLGSAILPIGLLITAVDTLGEKFPRLGKAFSDIASILKNSVIIAFESLKDALGIIRDQFVKTGDVLTRVFGGALRALGADAQRFADLVRNVMAPALATVGIAVAGAVPGLRELLALIAIVPGFERVSRALDSVAKSTQAAADKARGFVPALTSMNGAFVNGKFSMDAWRGSLLKSKDDVIFTADAFPAFSAAVTNHVVKPFKLGGEEAEKFGTKVEKAAEKLRQLSTAPIKIGIPTLPGIDISKPDFDAMLGPDMAQFRLKFQEGIDELPGIRIPPFDIPAIVTPLRDALIDFGLELPDIIFGALRSGSPVIVAVAAGAADTFAKVFAERLQAAGGDLSKLSGGSKAIGTVGVGLSAFIGGYGAGEQLGKGKGALAGAASGAMAGIPLAAVTGGLSIAVGAIAGAIGGLIGGAKKAKEQLAELRQHQAAVIQEFGGLAALKMKADELGISLGNALTTKNPNEFKRVMEALGEAIDAQKARLEGFAIAAEGINAKAALFAAPFQALIDARDKLGDDPFKTAEINAKLAAMGQVGQAEFERIGIFAAATFAGIVNETGDAVGAIQTLAPTFAILQSGINEFGLTSTGVIDSLVGMFQFVNDAVTGPIFQAIQATGQIFTGLQQGGLLTKEIFQTVGADIGASFRELEAKGGDVAKAMALSQPILQKLWEGQQLYGRITDETTQKILEQAHEQGLVGDHMKDVNQKILEVLISIADVFGAKLPEAFRATRLEAAATAADIRRDWKNTANEIKGEFGDAANGVAQSAASIKEEFAAAGRGIQSEFDLAAQSIQSTFDKAGRSIKDEFEKNLSKIKVPDIKVGLEVDLTGLANRNPIRIGADGLHIMGDGGIAKHPMLALIGDRGPEAVIPLNQLASVAPQVGSSTVILEMDGRVIAEVAVPHIPGAVRRFVAA